MLIAADRNIRANCAEHRIRLEAGIVPVVPPPVVAQASDSPHQVQLLRLLRGCQLPGLTDPVAHSAPRLLGRAGTPAALDRSLPLPVRNWPATSSPRLRRTSAACATAPARVRGSSALTADLVQLRSRSTPQPRSY